MNRADFRRLAITRLKEAQILLDKRSYSGAYYLSGYAVECALKACIARRTRRSDFPPEPAKVRKIYTHDLEKLLEAAGLGKELQKSKKFEVSWNVVKGWTEKSRYESRGRAQAKDILTAISDQEHGVLQWIKRHW